MRTVSVLFILEIMLGALACSSSPAEFPDAGISPEVADAATADAVATPSIDAASHVDAGPLEACLPPAGPPPSLGPRNDLIPISGPFAAGGVDKIAITPDSSTVIFIADAEQLGLKRLYSVPVGGGPILRLSHNALASPGQDVEDFALTPSGDRVIYRGDVDEEEQHQLYSVATAGGVITTLTDPSFQVLPLNFIFSPDGTWLLFKAQHPAPVLHTLLHSVPVDGGTVNTLSHQGVDSTQAVQRFGITADSLRVVFTGDTEVSNRERIYSVSITGGAIASLLPDGATALMRIDRDFALTTDSLSVVFAGEASQGARDRLYRASLVDGTVSVLLEEVDGGALEFISDPEVSSGNRILFQGAFFAADKSDFFSVSLIDGSSEILTKGVGSNSFNREQRVSPDGQYAFFAGTSVEGVRRIYSTLMAGGPLITLSQNIFETTNRSTYFPLITSDSERVIYTGNPDPDGVQRIFAVCTQGGEPLRLSPNSGPNTDLGNFHNDPKLSDDGRFALFKGEFLQEGVVQLFVADMLTGDILTVDSNVSDPSLSVDEFLISPDRSWIVFTGDQLFDGTQRLYSRELQ